MKTPNAESNPERCTDLTIHALDLIHILEGLRLLNKQPHHFDCSATDYRPLYLALLEPLKTLDPSYVNDMLDGGVPPHPRESPAYPPFRRPRGESI